MHKTQFDEHKRFVSNPGTPVHELYSPHFNDDGEMELVVTGYENIYDEIQSHKDSVDIHVILDRYKRGDVNALSRVQGVYGDFTTVPKSYADALNAVISAENYFASLPLEVRAKFDHSFQKFLVSMDKPGFADAMRFEAPNVAPPAEGVNIEDKQQSANSNVVQFPGPVASGG